MTMTNEEIVRDYNAAANKNKQIRILAELNIETILRALPEDASQCVRDTAGNLVITLFRDYVRRRLGSREAAND